MDKISDCNRGYEEEKDKQVDSTESNPREERVGLDQVITGESQKQSLNDKNSFVYFFIMVITKYAPS